MHPVRKQRLILVLAIVFGSSLLVGIAGVALKDYGNLFYSISRIQSGEAPRNKTIRAGGCVVPGSIEKASDRVFTTFVVTDGVANLTVTSTQLLPDLFSEGEAAVLTGVIGDNGIMVASKVLAKHDETYTPREVEDTVQNTSGNSRNCEGITYDS